MNLYLVPTLVGDVLGAILLALTGYLLVLTLAAVFGRRSGPPDARACRRFALLIPAHNEEALIERLVRNLRALDYPAALVQICVVADNCEDRTAELARALGARVYERSDSSRRAKGYALRWLLQQLRAEAQSFDAYVVLDADSIVSANFLRRMDAYLESGAQVVQAYYSVLNADHSSLAGLRHAALAAVHYLRPLGRSVLGLSCGLKGNGMCFASAVLDQFNWQWFTLAEDVEFHLVLVRAGIRVDFAHDTEVLADMPVTFAQAASQNTRWERGRIQLLRHQVPALLLEGVRRRSGMRIDAALEQLIPPLSIPFVTAAVALGFGIGVGGWLPLAGGLLSLSGQLAYLLASLMLVRAPLRTYVALTSAPVYIAWKMGLYVRALVMNGSPDWVRTQRVNPLSTGS